MQEQEKPTLVEARPFAQEKALQALPFTYVRTAEPAQAHYTEWRVSQSLFAVQKTNHELMLKLSK